MTDVTILDEINIEDMIYEIRGKQVMLDSDLAKLYKCTNGTKDINKAVKRNIDRFPSNFYFQLTDKEYKDILRFQNGTLELQQGKYTKYLPYVFTEEGVSMLASVLHTKVASNISIRIMRAFVVMRKYISNNLLELKNINNMLIRHENKFDYIDSEIKNLNTLFAKFEDNKYKNKIFMNGKIYDSHSFIIDILNKAKDEIIIIDNYADKTILDIISNLNINIILITKENNLLKNIDIQKYNKQYNNLKVIYNNDFHDRFIILDNNIIYHLGSSINHLGNKIFAINLIEENEMKNVLLNKVKELI